jgi:hypothetical protein
MILEHVSEIDGLLAHDDLEKRGVLLFLRINRELERCAPILPESHRQGGTGFQWWQGRFTGRRRMQCLLINEYRGEQDDELRTHLNNVLSGVEAKQVGV